MKKNREAAIIKHVVGVTGDGIWEWDKESKEVYVNDRFLDLLGYGDKEFTMKYSKLLKLVHPEDSQRLKKEIKQCFQYKIDIDCEVRIKSSDDRWMWFRVQGTALKNDYTARESQKIVGIINNINDKKEIKEELERKVFLDKIKTDYFTNLSHELRTPLNVLLGSLQLQKMYIDSDETSQYIEKYKKVHRRMKQNCYRLLRLVNNIIDMSRIDSGVYSIELMNYDIVELIKNIVLSIRDYGDYNNLKIEFNTTLQEEIIACDPEKIERIMLNLLSNAIKFTNSGGKIDVSLYKEDNQIKVSVKDSGIGIPEEKLEDIFNRFSQADKGKFRSKEGSGIGLSLVRSFVEMQSGSIDVKSKLNKGSEFIISLPKRIVNHREPVYNLSVISETNVERMQIEFSDIYLEGINENKSLA